MREHDDEPIRGLPGHLPAGERILWQGAPDWRTLARTALHTNLVAGYFGVLAAWRVLGGLTDGRGLADVLAQAAVTMAVGGGVVALLCLYAWLSARTTVYTITNRRAVIRHGVALSKALNLPFSRIASAAVKTDVKGFGDVPIALTPDSRLAYPLLWPHVRPWRFSRAEPMLRAIPDAASVADQLRQALLAAAREANRPYAVEPTPAPETAAAPLPVRTPVAA